ncbi:MAG: SDR family NAD(P)-dependent oxidoreductase [Boseongicola sp. SB0665_bin_10]|nr:SDR family NAD(P)-dependent oxidoreductase [Boseongicola sp. SB0665_bin_10]
MTNGMQPDDTAEHRMSSGHHGNETSRLAEPVAVVGMACRFPGAPDIPSFWHLLETGGNAVTDGAPASGPNRLEELFKDPRNLQGACRYCAYVDDIDQFDARFFRISPVEAELLDPQQRMMLETSWQALEDAGMDPDRLKESLTGVYSGISNDEYRMLVTDSERPGEAAASLYALSGTNLNGTCGRVSFVLGFMGPAKAVDAACASSLLSVHDAVADLQQGKADLAIAGGVQAILNSRIFELRADSMMLSPDGQCKAFDSSANGYVRGEGCGAVVLKRLRDAEADGDRIWAVIRGAAVNHGGASVGLTVPHEPALEKVIEAALSQAGIPASDVDYLEAHGTGTAVGDPIEINAVARVYGKGRKADQPLLVGSVKTNLGHLESAAGIAGLIKAVLVMQRGVIPKHLHFRDPNPSVDWDGLPLQVTSSMMDLPARNGRPRVAGVNSFGISGTNVHLLVEEYPASGTAPYAPDRVVGPGQAVVVQQPPKVTIDPTRHGQACQKREVRLLPLSAKSGQALRDLAKRYLSWLDEQLDAFSAEGGLPEQVLADMAWTAGVGRCHFDCRAGLTFDCVGQLRKQLEGLAETGLQEAPRAVATVAFAYTGQGSQWAGMGRDLYDREPVARMVFDRCEEVFLEERGTSLLDVMFGRDGNGQLGDTAWEQPALYALECALTAQWASVGIRPDMVLGHSVGEIAAAQAAGVFSLEDGMRFAATRGLLLSQTEGGAMAAVFAPPDKVEAAVRAANAESGGVGVNMAADNGLHQVVSGPVADIESLSTRLESEGVRVRRLNTTRAFHSALIEPVLDALQASLDHVTVQPPELTVVSNLTGRAVNGGQLLDGAYWRRHAREPVAFASGARTLAELGADVILEIGPGSVLAPMASSAWPESAPAPVVLSSLRPAPTDSPEGSGSIAEAVAGAYRSGLPIRFEGLFPGETRRRISVPGYPFQRERYWLSAPRQRRSVEGHPLLGLRRESASGEITYETDLFPKDPEWLNDHRVFERVIAPGALYGTMAASASRAGASGPVVVEDMQLHNPLVFAEEAQGDEAGTNGRKVQILISDSGDEGPGRLQILSKGSAETEWTLHAECRVAGGTSAPGAVERVDLERLKDELSPVDASVLYQARASTGIDLGGSFRSLGNLWARQGEALGEVSLQDGAGLTGPEIHPLVLDGCFQVVAAARIQGSAEDETTYLPFGWERLWLAADVFPEKVVCHVRMHAATEDSQAETGVPAEVLSGELRIYDLDGALLGGLDGYTIKRATRAALFSAIEGVNDLLYEVVWRERSLVPAIIAADFLPEPAVAAGGLMPLADYLEEEGVARAHRSALLSDLDRWSRARAIWTLEKLGWRRSAGEIVESEELRRQLGVMDEHKRVFRRILEMLARSDVLQEDGDRFVVKAGHDDPLPEDVRPDPESFADNLAELHPHGATEIGLFRRCGAALPDVLRGEMDPLTLLFSSGYPTPGDLYLDAPIARAANRLLRDAVRALVAKLPAGRRLRVIEVGAGTGSATASVLPELPEGRFDYMYTDISAGFFAEAESRFGDGGGCIEYRPLNIENDPVAQGFDAHAYDLIIASNVLHATRYLDETLGHCLTLLAPSGQMVALENLRGQGWMDLTFGQLDGWWRFADDYRPHHALASPDVWRRALGDAGFDAAEILGLDASRPDEMPDRGVIVAKGPDKVSEAPGTWVLVADRGDMAAELADGLAARNQTVLVVSDGSECGKKSETNGVATASVDFKRRESWQALLEDLPDDAPFSGVVHLPALEGHGAGASTGDIAQDVQHAGASALALVQGVIDSDRIPGKGIWFVTRGAQALERETNGALAGATLWGFGKAVAREAAHLVPRMIDLDPTVIAPAADLVDELMYPDSENHIAVRRGVRQAARLVRTEDGPERLDLPQEADWVLTPDPTGVFEKPCVTQLPALPLEGREVRVAVEAAGLNFWDVFRSLGFIEEGNLGREMCGRVVAVGPEVANVSAGDQVVGLGFGAFAGEMVTHEELVAPAPPDIPVSGLATVPSAFVSAALSYELSGLEADDRVLIHAGAGGVGLAAIQLARAAGAEVFATASAPKQAYLKSLGVKHVFDSRQTDFGKEILDATDGAGVTVVLNSLTSEGFIDASLSCLAQGGRFVELARRDILSVEEMAALRPDVAYDILELDVLKKTDPEWVGRVLRDVVARVAAGELKPLIHSRWPLAEAGAALRFMRSARHLGKIVVAAQPLASGRLREDRTYLVTGGLGGIGLAVAEWLADLGAGTIVLNGRRSPGEDAQEAIRALEGRGVTVRVELADVSKDAAVDEMLARMDEELPPLAGVIHSVGVLSDGALTNQNWDRFETVLWPKVLGAWHLHRATANRDLDLFLLFSSRVGVMGNPGQANHASANAFLDQLAGHRRALGLPGQAIAWGAWSEIGEAAEQKDRIERQRSALGGRWFTPQQGIRALDRLVRQDVTTSVVMAMDWSVFEEAVDDRPAFLEDLLSSVAEDGADAGVSSEDLLSRLANANAEERDSLLVTFLQQELQAVLRLPSAPAPTVGFFDLGMDSLMAVELRNRLNRAFAGQCKVSNTVVFDYPEIQALARHIGDELGEIDSEAAPRPSPDPQPKARRAQEPQPPAQPAPKPQPEARSVPEQQPKAPPVPQVQPASERSSGVQHDQERIAIVGMACRLPGAPDLFSYWRQLKAGAEAVTDGRRDEGPWSGIIGDPTAAEATNRRGGFVEGLDKFDAKFFGIQPIEARKMDPRQRMLLETSWHALEDAGIDPGLLKGTRASVFAGLGSSEYRDLIAAAGQDDSYLGTAASVAIGRIAFSFGFMGPAVPLDMTCAASLVAVHQAAASLRQREVDLALAGGVHAILSPPVMRFMREYGMLSRTGLCRTFDADADGFVRGEGCGIVILKRLKDAEADGDRIWGVVQGSAVNQNGAAAALTVPNGTAQERLYEEALAQAGIAPRDLDYLEVHGTGSELGDPIEVRAASAVYGRERDAERPLLLGTVKTNIGHLEAAAGVAGLIKVLLSMRHGVIPKHLHFRNPNPHIDWDELPVQVTAQETAWPPAPHRQPTAGISAFGISGTNAHLLVEGYKAQIGEAGQSGVQRSPAGSAQRVSARLPMSPGNGELVNGGLKPRGMRLLPLSGKSSSALKDLADRYLGWLDEHAADISSDVDAGMSFLADMSWTAAIGRSHFECRAGVIFKDVPTLTEGLEQVSAGGSTAKSQRHERPAFVYSGEAGDWQGKGRVLYDCEPVARAVLERCDAALREEHGMSLFDTISGEARNGDDPLLMQTSAYALQCAVTALWSSLGISPGAICASGIGEIAAAQAAGVFDLETGVLLAARRGQLNGNDGVDWATGDVESFLEGVSLAPVQVPLLDGKSGQMIQPGTMPDRSNWSAGVFRSPESSDGLAASANLGETTIVEIGPDGEGGHVRSAANVYEAGLALDFAGLFAGEARRRISVPGYPFQRRSFWFDRV